MTPFSISKGALPSSTCRVVLRALGCGLSLCVEALGGRAPGGQRYLLLIHLGPCGPGMAVVTPTGKPPPLAVRLAKALPFRRAQREMRDALTAHDNLHTADGAHTCIRVGVDFDHMPRATLLHIRNGRRGFPGPSGPFPTSVAPSGGLHHTTRSAGGP